MSLLGAAATFSSSAFAAANSNLTATPLCDGDDHGKKGSSAIPQCDGDGKKGSSATPQCDGDGKKGSSRN